MKVGFSHDQLGIAMNFLASPCVSQLLEEVARVNFTFNSQPVYFSQTKDLPTGYELVQWNITAPGNVGFVSVGSYDNQLHELSINESKISWNTRSGKVCSGTDGPSLRVGGGGQHSLPR